MMMKSWLFSKLTILYNFILDEATAAIMQNPRTLAALQVGLSLRWKEVKLVIIWNTAVFSHCTVFF